jgi:hypothetical protein
VIFTKPYKMNGMIKLVLLFVFIVNIVVVFAQDEEGITIIPQPYEKALKNPLMGFTTINVDDHPWASVSHTYIKWNELENNKSDGIEKIINSSNQKWKNAAAKNMKVIPRVYLHWDGDKKYWPADMQADDYTSEQFQERVLRLIKRLGACWDNDPRVAFIEMGIIGKWGEHHSPSPSAATQKLLGDAFAAAFKNKKISVRHMWDQFTDHPYGEYWDSWAHYDQMWGHGNSIKKVNDQTGRYKETYIGGEVAYGWGNTVIQPGETPTHSVALQKHRDFVINSIRWLHCTQLRWITGYDKTNTDAIKGAEEIQKAFGYRYVLDEVRFSVGDSLKVSFDVTNTGSAPFYYNWPVEVALLDSVTRKPVWKAKMNNVDIRKWLPGDGWTDPEWKYVGSWQEYHPNENWNPSKTSEWATPPVKYRIEDKFKVEIPNGSYILSLAVLDPAGDLPSVKFATVNYLKGGRHPMGLVKVGENKCDTLPIGFKFDDPNTDNTLFYTVDFKIDYEEEPVVKDHVQTPHGGKAWQFPTDTVPAWQYDFINNFSGNKYFSLDSSKTIGIYGCNDTTGYNIRTYKDSVLNKNAAQLMWNQTAGTFQENGQWLKYSADFNLNVPYQLRLRARNNVDANFKLTVLSLKGDTILFKIFNLKNDFKNTGGGNEQTDWYLSKNEIKGLWGSYILRFDWYDNLGEPGIFGGFSFVVSELDFTPPKWHYVSLGTFDPGSNIVVMTTENATVYLVPQGTLPDTVSIKSAAISLVKATAYKQAILATSVSNIGGFVAYAIDASGNISEATKVILIQYPVSAAQISPEPEVKVSYISYNQIINVKSTRALSHINVYNILGKKVCNTKCGGNNAEIQTTGFVSGVYLVHVYEKEGSFKVVKIVIQ